MHSCRDGAVQDADNGKREEHGLSPQRCLGEQVDAEAKHAVRAHFEEHAGQDDRAARWCLRVCVGQPGVQWEQRNFDGERNHECNEEPAARAGCEIGFFGDLYKVEREVADVAACEECGGDDAHQHERGAGHGVDEKLGCRVHALFVAPVADEEIHRHQHDFEEHEEQEQVEAEETAHDARLEQQHPGKVWLLVVVWVDADDDEREEHAGEHHQEQRDAVDTEVPRDAPLTDPRLLRDELKACLTAWKLGQHVHAECARDEAEHECNELDLLGLRLVHERDHYGADERQYHEQRE